MKVQHDSSVIKSGLSFDNPKNPLTGSHLLDGVLVDEMVVVFVQGAVQRNAVRFEQQILEKEDGGVDDKTEKAE